MMELILLAGLIALFVAHRRSAVQITVLQQQIDALFASQHPQTHLEAPPPPPMRHSPWVAKPRQLPSADLPSEPAPDGPRHDEVPAVRETLASLFERFVGGRLLIWIGGIALAVAGVFLVRYSIEIGLVTPQVRMFMAAAFGILLVAGGEVARSRPATAGDPRIAQALVGAGILVLYAATYGSLELYGLIGLGTASALMVLITAAALVLSLRHGSPTAILGLIGGFLTPLLVGDPESSAVPLLAYLALLNTALFAIAYRRGWGWLAGAAVLLSFLWSAAFLFGGSTDALAAGLFVLLLGLAGSLTVPGGGGQMRRILPAAIGLVQLAALVSRADLGAAAWALFGALAAATLLLERRGREYRLLPPFALLLALALLAVKAGGPGDPLLPWVGAAIALLFAGFAFPRSGREEDRALWTGVACAALAAPLLILRVGQPDLAARPIWALLALLVGVGPVALAWRQRAHARQQGQPDAPLLFASATAALLLAVAAFDLVPLRLLASAWLIVAMAVALGGRRLADWGVSLLAVVVAGLGLVAAVQMVPELWTTILMSLAGSPALVTGLPPSMLAFWALLLPSLLLVPLALLLPGWMPRERIGIASAAGVLFAGAAYVAFKQVFALAGAEDMVARGFAERLVLTQALFAGGWLLSSGRLSVPHVDKGKVFAAGGVLTAIAAARFVWFDLLLHNPALDDQWVGPLPILNLLLPSYLGSAFWLYEARRRADGGLRDVWLGLFLAALIAGVMLLVRQGFQGPLLSRPEMPLGEFYAYSLAGLLLSIGLLLAGVRLGDKPLRFAGFLLLTVTILKVFLVDAAELEGILRILSFLGLGVALIGVGMLYGKVLAPAARGPAQA